MRFKNWCRAHIRLLLTEGILLILFVALSIYGGQIKRTQYSQNEANRWANDGTKYHQVSAFLEQDLGILADQINEVRSSLQSALIEASYTDDSTTGRLWIDAYAAQTMDSISKESETGSSSVAEVEIIGVGGDFFQFHMLDMVAGSTFSKDDISLDRIVIDEQTAWNLYGSNDITGKIVMIAGKEFAIAGVYQSGETKQEHLAKGEKSYLFIPYETFHMLYPDLGISSYEAVLPNPVKDYAISSLKKAFGESEDAETEKEISGVNFKEREYLDNTDRFKTLTLLGKMRYQARQLMRTNEIAYPYWENMVRLIEVKLEVIILLKTLLFIVFILLFLWNVRKEVKVSDIAEIRKNLTKLLKQLIIERLRHILKGRLTGRERKVFEKREHNRSNRNNRSNNDNRDNGDSSVEI